MSASALPAAVPPPAPVAARRGYVTAFPGRRDSYQVPEALQEHGRLERFVTDAYAAGPLAGALRRAGLRSLDRRRNPALPAARVAPGFDLELGGRLLARLMPPSRAAVVADDWLARRAAAEANRRDASVLLYEFQAELGFQLLRSPRQRRVLFHFHPHPHWEHPRLLADARQHPEFLPALRSAMRADLPPRFVRHTCEAWRGADAIIVASGCTRDSLIHAGCPADRITVVPYGCGSVEAAAPLRAAPRRERPFLLWVGTGSFRKGLHHLCAAWQALGRAGEADLVVVARSVEPALEARLAAAGIQWIRGLPRAELDWHFAHAHAFVLPSLAEGFGHVYLEALGHGCRVVGTRHSVLPDLTAAQPWIHYADSGDPVDLAARLESVLRLPPSPPAERAAIAASVREFTWARFRAGIETVLARLD